ncbi:MAG: hypothetical protein EXQ51_05210 [Acidobacteria bacterium]|nr:hypothetical protein [Acidobacteriota bacterium]
MTPSRQAVALVLLLGSLVALPHLVETGEGTDDQAEALALALARTTAGEPTAPAGQGWRERGWFLIQGAAGLGLIVWAMRSAGVRQS